MFLGKFYAKNVKQIVTIGNIFINGTNPITYFPNFMDVLNLPGNLKNWYFYTVSNMNPFFVNKCENIPFFLIGNKFVEKQKKIEIVPFFTQLL